MVDVLNYLVKVSNLYRVLDNQMPKHHIRPCSLALPPIDPKYRTALLAEANGFLEHDPSPINGDYKVYAYYGDKKQEITHETFSKDWNPLISLAWAYHYTKDKVYFNAAQRIVHSWIFHLDKPLDGAVSAIEWLRARWEADTPIVTACQFPKFMLACWLIGITYDKNIRDWLKTYVQYVEDYYPAVNNNHRSFKALTLITYGAIFENDHFLNSGYSSFLKSVAEINGDGRMPLELDRGAKAASYTLMNLEALVSCEWWLTKFGITPYTRNAINNFKMFFDDSKMWNCLNKSTLNKPDSPSDWGWIFVAANSLTSTCIRDWYGINVPRAYNLLYPELLSNF